MEKYGPIGYIVLIASNLTAGIWAIRTAALGKALWEPRVQEFPRAPVKIAGVVAIVLIAVVFSVSNKNKDIFYWLPWALWCGVVVIVSFLIDVFLRTWLIVRCSPNAIGVFGGIWLTKRARAIVRGSQLAYDNKDLSLGQAPPAGPKALYCSFPANARDVSRIWPQQSVALATAVVVGDYILWNALATVAVALAATLVAIAVS
jgi:hypothetical protein